MKSKLKCGGITAYELGSHLFRPRTAGLEGIYEYIAYSLLAPDTASAQAGRIMKEIRSLEEIQLRYQLYEDEPWHSQGLRFFPVGNSLVFYLPDEIKRTVTVVRIMYGGRDVDAQLNKTIMS